MLHSVLLFHGVLQYSTRGEGRAEKGDMGLWKFTVFQDSATCMAAGLAREQQLCSPKSSRVLKFTFTPHHWCSTRGAVLQEMQGEVRVTATVENRDFSLL